MSNENEIREVWRGRVCLEETGGAALSAATYRVTLTAQNRAFAEVLDSHGDEWVPAPATMLLPILGAACEDLFGRANRVVDATRHGPVSVSPMEPTPLAATPESTRAGESAYSVAAKHGAFESDLATIERLVGLTGTPQQAWDATRDPENLKRWAYFLGDAFTPAEIDAATYDARNRAGSPSANMADALRRIKPNAPVR